MKKTRKGASSLASVEPDILIELNCGRIEAATLVENLATDFNVLLAHTLPDLAAKLTLPSDLGITKKMLMVASGILAHSGADTLAFLEAHPSDLVRGWGAYVSASLPDLSLALRVDGMRAYADDSHFGVREWAWLALRPYVVKAPIEAIGFLAPWVHDSSANIRRFAVEATRPRGVWSAHIPTLKKAPDHARVLLDPVVCDPSRYVQDSVANWLNDAWKTSPDWVETYCGDLAQSALGKETEYILKRALRNKV